MVTPPTASEEGAGVAAMSVAVPPVAAGPTLVSAPAIPAAVAPSHPLHRLHLPLHPRLHLRLGHHPPPKGSSGRPEECRTSVPPGGYFLPSEA